MQGERKRFGRRLFLIGAAAARLAPKVALLAAVPVLYSDGLHDDAEALEAALNGLPYRWADGRPALKQHVSRGRFLLRRTIVVTQPGAVLTDSYLEYRP